MNESFANGTNAAYIDQLYEDWLVDPASVHKSWDAYFKNVEAEVPAGRAFVSPAELAATDSDFVKPAINTEAFSLALGVQRLIDSYQVFGHKVANLDPLGIREAKPHPELQPERWGFTKEDLQRDISDLGQEVLSDFFSGGEKYTLENLISDLHQSYSTSIGVEFMHIQDAEQVRMINREMEQRGRKNFGVAFTPEQRAKHHKRLMWATTFEEFLHSRWNEKRFGCDGAEVIIPGMESMVDAAAELGVKKICIGMAHRGRLNVLANVMRKPLPAILHEFQRGTDYHTFASGDVKYHLGTSCDRKTAHGLVHLSLQANPSHLEAVDPVVEGKIAAAQNKLTPEESDSAMPVLIHGDASFVGQGVVYETITLAKLRHFHTRGTIHVVLNNQIGFTTSPEDSRPGDYCTDVAKSAGAPIFHVNGDDVDAVCFVFQLATKFRQKFHKDVVVDIICYRRFGHNEMDQPRLTQPLMYSVIEKHPKLIDMFSEKLIQDGVLNLDQVQALKDNIWTSLDEAAQASEKYEAPQGGEWLSDEWAGFKSPLQLASIRTTGITEDKFNTVGEAICKIPSGFSVHPIINRSLQAKSRMLLGRDDLDWATAEAMAFGSLLLEGFNVRLVGQDVQRGTFSHRHAVLHDQLTDETYTPLQHIPGAQGKFFIENSFLSEYGVLGYELGYSLAAPNTLTMWEAQFGDFANGAQIMIDQFISSGEQKWLRQSGLVLLLPHGFEGQGPEHSSARIERFLAMCDPNPDVIPAMDFKQRMQIQQTNWQVVNCTTPANYFHVLRRQLHREFRKPLIIFTPKSLLRHPLAKSPRDSFDDVGDDTRFLRVYWEVDPLVDAKDVRKVIFCSGKVYYDLLEQRRASDIKDIALIRIEQLSPFPFDHVSRELKRYPNAKVIWCQEEPKNQGAWSYLFFFFKTTLKSMEDSRKMAYVGRPPSASPATGSSFVHKKEQKELVSEALE